MAILTKATGAHSVTTAHLIESGTGTLLYTPSITGAKAIELNVSKLDLPMPLAATATIEVLSGFVAILTGTTPTAIAAPTAQLDGSEEYSGAAAIDVQAGNGAAIIENGTDEVYVRLNQISYPFEFDGTNSDAPSIKVLGENSFLGY